jgi:stress response protein SCP2
MHDDGRRKIMDLSKGDKLDTLTVQLTWSQPEHKGMLGGLRNRANRTDVDLSAIAFAGDKAIDYVDAKTRPGAPDVGLTHSGDAKSGDGAEGETIVVKLSGLDDDITAFAITLSCATGNFTKITGAKAVFTNQDGTVLGRVRFDVTSRCNGALLGFVKRDGSQSGWEFVESGHYGDVSAANYRDGQAWRDLASIAKSRITAHR